MGNVKVLKASAGSGKTYRLAYEYVKNVILNPISYRSILGVTFTNKATTEMKSRILDEIDLLCSSEGFMDGFVVDFVGNEFSSGLNTIQLREKISKNARHAQRLLLHDYSNFSVMTIDKFFQKIFRAFCKELNIDTSYSIGLNDGYFLSLAVDSVIDNYQDNPQLVKWIATLLDSRIEEGKKFNFKDDILSISNKIFSKEFNRELYLKNLDEIELFFKQIALMHDELTVRLKIKAKELKERIDGNGLFAEDFYQSARGLYPYVVSMSNGEFKSCNSYVNKMLDISTNWSSKNGKADAYKHELQPMLLELVESWEQDKKTFNTIDLILSSHREFLLLLYVSKELDSVCRTNNTLLLSSSLRIITSLINNNDIPYIYEKIGNRYDILMIDEFQDTSNEQWNNFIPIAENSISMFDDSYTAVTLVGDVKQSIYMWRGGDWGIFEYEVPNSFSRDILDIETLDTNWRSERNIVTFNNLIIRSALEQLNTKNNEDIEKAFERGSVSSRFRDEYYDVCRTIYTNMEQRVSPKNIDTQGYIQVSKCIEEDENLLESIRAIEDCQLRGFQPKDIAILVRSKKQIPLITEYFSLYKKSKSAVKGVSYDVMSKDGLLLKNSSLVSMIIFCYRLAVDISDNISMSYVKKYHYNNYVSSFSDSDILFFEGLNKVSICESFEMICSEFKLNEKIEEIAYLQAIHDRIIEFSRGVYPDIEHFLECWENDGYKWGVELPSEQNAIRIETIHAVKGLEFNVVIIPYCFWNFAGKSGMMWASSSDERFDVYGPVLVPKGSVMEDSYFSEPYYENCIKESIESFNILYVALTRASRELYMMINTSSRMALKSVLLDSFVEDGDTVNIISDSELLQGIIDENCYAFGVKSQNISKLGVGSNFVVSYPSSNYKERVVLRNSNDRYFSQESVDDSRRELGILKHRVLEQINYIDDIDTVLSNMTQQGELTAQQSLELQDSLQRSISNPLIADFFDSRWDVRNESSILTYDDQYRVYRPDRVISLADKAVVIDYKFGKRHKRYRSQMDTYISLLREMGYRDVLGYIWYIEQEDIEQV